MESSAGVLVMDTNSPSCAHSGSSVVPSSLDIAYRSGNTLRVNRALRLITHYPFLEPRRCMFPQQVQKVIRILSGEHQSPLRRSKKPFRNGVVEHGKQRIIIAFDV